MRRFLLFLAIGCIAVSASAGQQDQPKFRISGVVVDAVAGTPIPGAKVSAVVDGEETVLTAGGDGKFVLEGVPAGKYPLTAWAQGYLREGYNQHGMFSTAIAVGEGLDSENVVFRIHPQAVLHGKVTDERGEAVRGAQVLLFKETNGRGRRKIEPRGQAQTNDLGEYRFAHLFSGKFYIAVQARPWYAQTSLRYQTQPQNAYGTISRLSVPRDPALDVVYPITFYPGVTDEESAGQVDLSVGEEEEADIQLQAVPAVHLRLTNFPVTKDDTPGYGIGATRKIFGVYSAGLPVESGEITPGEYEVAGLPPGRVELTINRYGAKEPFSARVETNADDGGTADAARAEAGANVSGRVAFPGGTAGTTQGQVILIRDDGQNVSASLGRDGTFKISNVVAGTYRVSVGLPIGGLYVARVVASGAKTFGRKVTLEGGDATLTVTLGRGFGEIKGVAKLNGKPTAGAMVLLVPASGEKLEEDTRMDQSDSDGTFRLASIPPGKYELVAIEDGWDLEWAKAGVLDPYREKGQAIEIAANEKRDVTVEIQKKVGSASAPQNK